MSAVTRETVAAGGLEPISKQDLRAMRGGLVLLMGSLVVPVIVMMNVRYVMSEGYTPPNVPVAIGWGTTALLIISAWTMWRALGGARRGDLTAVFGNLNITIALGLLAMVGMMAQMAHDSVPSVSHYGEVFLSTVGMTVFYMLTAIITLFAVHMRSRRIGVTPGHHWGIEAATRFWLLNVVAWILVFIDLYFV